MGAILIAGPTRASIERERLLRLACPETGERFEDVYWRDGAYLPEAMRRIDWLMRDFHRDVVAVIDPHLVDALHGIAQAVGARQPISVLSGYRTRATNTALRHEGMPAVLRSEHLVARAADIRIERVPIARLHRAAILQQAGGVGTYGSYVHVDTGPVRRWWEEHPHPPSSPRPHLALGQRLRG